MKRRIFLTLGTGFAVSVLTGFKPTFTATDRIERGKPVLSVDLEPDGLAKTYRRYHLLIIGQKDDDRSSELAKVSVDVLTRFLPDSRSRLIRAADIRRVGVLIGTRQQDVAIMSKESATALFQATPPFSDIRNVPLRIIVSFGNHVLVCREDFSPRNAFILAQTLSEHRSLLPAWSGAARGAVPAHDGSLAYFTGKSMPDR